MELDKLLKVMTDKRASDLHLKPTRPPLLRIAGRLMPLDAQPLKLKPPGDWITAPPGR